MSIDSWSKEFGGSKKSKIIGLSKQNLRKHNVSVNNGQLHELIRVRGAFVPKSKTIFKNSFSECCLVTDEQQRAYDYWLKTNDATQLIKSFTQNRLSVLKDSFFGLLSAMFVAMQYDYKN